MRTAIALVLAVSSIAAWAGPSFVSLNENSGLNAINNNGQAAGWAYVNWSPSSIMFDGTVHPIAMDGDAFDINDRGDVLYRAVNPDTAIYGVWDSGWGCLVPGRDSMGFAPTVVAINNSRHIAGAHLGKAYVAPVDSFFADPWCPNPPPAEYSLYAFSFTFSVALDLNDMTTVGYCEYNSNSTTPGRVIATYWIGDVPVSIGRHGHYSSEATAVSLSGEIAGCFRDSSNVVEDAFLYNDDNGFTELTGMTESPVAINDLDVVLGATTFCIDGAVYHIQGLMPAGWTLKGATDINNANQVVGSAFGPDGLEHGFILQVPEPTSMALLCFGIAAVLRRRR